ncbi:hypothetical protein OTU49_017108 [Cherax quadricarinatus]|uniref:Small ribosomal subunit protein mS23 n=1 Tax=Cherax quadricarinatus TaxID=27406 RepID=A0AAW0Y1H6_CHEQU|nr:28S ribosomal protein S23, mitochondrial-like isoform X2 [Cherax quadricarinatus]
MAGNRLEKIGTIFTRATGLLKSGAMKPQDKPLWYNVYEAFPPKYEPCFDRPAPEVKIRKIFYPEDVIRAKFYKRYGSYGTAQLSDQKPRPTVCQLFVKEYEHLQAKGSVPEDQLMQEAALALEAQGIYLDRSRAPVKTESSLEQEDEQQHPEQQLTTIPNIKQVKLEKLSIAEIFKQSQGNESN